MKTLTSNSCQKNVALVETTSSSFCSYVTTLRFKSNIAIHIVNQKVFLQKIWYSLNFYLWHFSFIIILLNCFFVYLFLSLFVFLFLCFFLSFSLSFFLSFFLYLFLRKSGFKFQQDNLIFFLTFIIFLHYLIN